MDEDFFVHWYEGDVAARYWIWRGLMVRHIMTTREFRVSDDTVNLFLERAKSFNLPFNEELAVKFIYQITADTLQIYSDFLDYEKSHTS